MKKTAIIIILFAIIAIFLINEGIIDQDRVTDLITGFAVQEQTDAETRPQQSIETTADPQVFFCPENDCEQSMLDFLSTAEQSIHCAFFDLDLEKIILLLKEKSESSEKIDVKLVVDNDNWKEIEPYNLTFAIKDTSSQLSHNKF